MKKIYHILLIMLAMSFGLIACTEETPFSTATENDDPRILDPLFPDRVNGELPVVSNISRDANFSMTLTVTPADYTTVTWFIDGEEITALLYSFDDLNDAITLPSLSVNAN